MVADRNGNAKKLIQVSQALMASDPSGTVKMRTGALDDPIVAGLLQSLLDGKGALVRNGQGVIGVATPAGDDLYLAYIGGVVQWVDVIPRSNVFNQDDIQQQTGKLVTISCIVDGKVTLGYLDIDNSDYLYSEDGIVRGRSFCDAPEAANLDAVFGCKDGILSKINPVNGHALVGKDGIWTTQEVGSSLVIDRTNIYTKTYSVDAGAVNTDNINVTTIPGYDVKWKWVKLHFSYKAQTSTTDFSHEVTVNGRKYIEVNLIAGSFQGEGNNNTADVPIPENKILTVVNTRTLFQPGSASGQQYVNIWADGWQT